VAPVTARKVLVPTPGYSHEQTTKLEPKGEFRTYATRSSVLENMTHGLNEIQSKSCASSKHHEPGANVREIALPVNGAETS
jgi:hypothetical protein